MVAKRKFCTAYSHDSAWDASDDESPAAWEDASANIDDHRVQFKECVDGLFQLLYDKYMTTDTLTAKEFCICCHYLSGMGAERADLFAMKPECSTGHYQRHLDLV